jgi:hypothetical protein
LGATAARTGGRSKPIRWAAAASSPSWTFPRLAGTSGLVGLRVEAWDADGNRTVQTVSNAFGLAAR